MYILIKLIYVKKGLTQKNLLPYFFSRSSHIPSVTDWQSVHSEPAFDPESAGFAGNLQRLSGGAPGCMEVIFPISYKSWSSWRASPLLGCTYVISMPFSIYEIKLCWLPLSHIHTEVQADTHTLFVLLTWTAETISAASSLPFFLLAISDFSSMVLSAGRIFIPHSLLARCRLKA